MYQKRCGFEIFSGKVLGTEECNGQNHVLTLMSYLIHIKSGHCYHLQAKVDKEFNINLEFYKMS